MLSGGMGELNWVPGAQGEVAIAVDHCAADVEVLFNDDHRRAEVAGADGGGKPRGSCPQDDDIRFVVPSNGLRLRGGTLRGDKPCCANADCGTALHNSEELETLCVECPHC